MTLCSFGKFTRKLRIDHYQTLKDMASILGVKPQYLSAVELGKRDVPYEWKDKIINYYSLNENKICELCEAIRNSQRVLKLDLTIYDEEDKKLILSFIRNFSNLEDEDKLYIRKILDSVK